MPIGKELRESAAVTLLVMAAVFLLPVPRWAEPALEPPVEEAQEPAPVQPAEETEKSGQPLRVLLRGQLREMELEDYLAGVLRGEMPASFAPEALKAQAVAARTYTVRKCGKSEAHPQADLCDDPGCCQAWTSAEEAAEGWGREARTYEAKIQSAVRETAGEVLLYEGEPILAVFHAASPGRTRRAGAVWQKELPYLQSVSSPEQGERIPNYYSRKTFTPQELRQRLAPVGGKLEGSVEDWLRNPVSDDSGSIETVEVGGVPVKGTRLRELLGLRSACFRWEVQEGKIVFFVTGYGHGVGMSQYGADQLARDGADYREILAHYYPGTEVGSAAGTY